MRRGCSYGASADEVDAIPKRGFDARQAAEGCPGGIPFCSSSAAAQKASALPASMAFAGGQPADKRGRSSSQLEGDGSGTEASAGGSKLILAKVLLGRQRSWQPGDGRPPTDRRRLCCADAMPRHARRV